jgi:MFS family permease
LPPFALIQVAGFSAALTATSFLPFTLIMGVLSRWSGGVLDRFGARWLLMIGSAIAALGFGLLALPVGGQSYLAFLGPIAIIGVGMVISVAPLATTVINVVPTHQAGVASGINNAVASVANLLAIAALGALALGTYNQALDDHLERRSVSGDILNAVQNAHGQFVTAPALSTVHGEDRLAAEKIIKESLARSIRLVMLAAAALALAGAASGAMLPRASAGTSSSKADAERAPGAARE